MLIFLYRLIDSLKEACECASIMRSVSLIKVIFFLNFYTHFTIVHQFVLDYNHLFMLSGMEINVNLLGCAILVKYCVAIT